MDRLSSKLLAGALSLFLGAGVASLAAAPQEGTSAEPMHVVRSDAYAPAPSYACAPYDASFAGGCLPCEKPSSDRCSRLAASVEYLFWTINQPGLDIVQVVGQDCITTRHFDFKAKSGYRLGASYQLPCSEDWSLNFSYSYFHPRVCRTFDQPNFCVNSANTPLRGVALVPLNVLADVSTAEVAGRGLVDFSRVLAPQAQAEVKLKYDLYDLVFSKGFGCPGEWALSPYFGARVAWVRERVKADLLNPLEQSAYRGGYTWCYSVPAAGITGGFHGRYRLCGPLSIVAHLGASVLGGTVKHNTQIRNATGCLAACFCERHTEILTGWDGSLGLGYDVNFCECPVRIAATYEMQTLNNVPQRVRHLPFPTHSHSHGSLTLHGLVVRAAVAF